MNFLFDPTQVLSAIPELPFRGLSILEKSLEGIGTFVGAFLALPITLSFLVCAVMAVVTVLVMFALKVILGLGGVWQFMAATAVVVLLPLVPMSRVFISFVNRLVYFRARLLPLDAAGDVKEHSAGFKARGLAKLVVSGLPVPPGFVVSGEVFRRWVKNAGLENEILEISAGENAEKKIQELLSGKKLPAGVARKMRRWLRRLGAERVIIRSSFPGEDSGRTSMAGVYRSVKAEAAGGGWQEALKEVWASYFSIQARVERDKHGIPHDDFRLPVIVQEFMEYDVAVAAASVNFLNGRTEEMLFDAVGADGRRGVSVFDMLTGSAGRVQGEELLAPGIMEKLSGDMLRLEAAYGVHVQIEAGLKGGRRFVHQVRPLTGFLPRDTYVNSYIVDLADVALTPLSRGLFDLPDSLEELIREKFAPFGAAPEARFIHEIDGRFYLHYNRVRGFLNPHRLRGPGMAAGSVVAAWRNIKSAMGTGRWRKEIEKAAAPRPGPPGPRRARGEALPPLFRTQFELFHAADFLLKTVRGLLLAVLGRKGEVAVLVERAAAPAGVSPYSEMLSELGRLDRASEEAVKEFAGRYGHWGSPEAEVAAVRLGEDPARWLAGAGLAVPGGAAAEGGRDAAIRRLERMLDEAWKGSLINPARYVFRLLVGKLGETLLLRERVRDLLNRFLYEIKKEVLASEYGEDGFYMTPEELESGGADAGVVKRRREAHGAAVAGRPGPVVHVPAGEARAGMEEEGKLYGMGVGSGVAEGAALVEPREFRSWSGEKYVLVVRSPEGMYGALLPGAAALVVERGGPLSHLVLLAREAGLPVVVGAAGSCGALRGGERVRVDGEKGCLEIVL